jgi:hypothetical protein
MAYRDCNGNEFESYEAACYYYGAETPAQIAAEDAYYAAEELAQAELTDALLYEALAQAPQAFGPKFWDSDLDLDDECPF